MNFERMENKKREEETKTGRKLQPGRINRQKIGAIKTGGLASWILSYNMKGYQRGMYGIAGRRGEGEVRRAEVILGRELLLIILLLHALCGGMWRKEQRKTNK
jgi:hypothetical protein